MSDFETLGLRSSHDETLVWLCVWHVWNDRAAKGSWRKRGDRPVGVDWNERVINIHEGGWNYVTNNVGIAPGTTNDESRIAE